MSSSEDEVVRDDGSTTMLVVGIAASGRLQLDLGHPGQLAVVSAGAIQNTESRTETGEPDWKS